MNLITLLELLVAIVGVDAVLLLVIATLLVVGLVRDAIVRRRDTSVPH